MLAKVESFTPRPRVETPRRPRIAFRSGESTFYPHLDEVIWIQARRNYSEIHTCKGSFVVREVLASLERRLGQRGFLRIQRSWIINLEHVVEIRRERRARYAIVLIDGTSIDVPAPIKDLVEELLAPIG